MHKVIRWPFATGVPRKTFPKPEQRLAIDNQKRSMMYNQSRTASSSVFNMESKELTTWLLQVAARLSLVSLL